MGIVQFLSTRLRAYLGSPGLHGQVSGLGPLNFQCRGFMPFDPGAVPYVRLLLERNWVKSNVFETLVRQVQKGDPQARGNRTSYVRSMIGIPIKHHMHFAVPCISPGEIVSQI